MSQHERWGYKCTLFDANGVTRRCGRISTGGRRGEQHPCLVLDIFSRFPLSPYESMIVIPTSPQSTYVAPGPSRKARNQLNRGAEPTLAARQKMQEYFRESLNDGKDFHSGVFDPDP